MLDYIQVCGLSTIETASIFSSLGIPYGILIEIEN